MTRTTITNHELRYLWLHAAWQALRRGLLRDAREAWRNIADRQRCDDDF